MFSSLRYTYRRVDNSCATAEQYVREDAINSEAFEHFRQAYPDASNEITADSVFYYVYGLLHFPEYRARYTNNLQKELPHIPRVASYADFKSIERAGYKLAHLHVDYESIELYNGFSIEKNAPASLSDAKLFHVEKLAYGKISGKKVNTAKDKTKVIYN